MSGRTSNIDIAQAADLQSAIQSKLEERGYSEDGDAVMAEYVTVMLANSKTSDQITSELTELIGPDYEASLTDWIFDTAIPEHYTKKLAGSSSSGIAEVAGSSTAADTTAPAGDEAANAASTQFEVNSIQTVQDSREHQGGGHRQGGRHHDLPNRPQNSQQNGSRGGGGGGGAQQRGNGVFGSAITGIKREGDSSGERPNRRARLSEPNGEGGADGNNRRNNNNNGGRRGEKSIFDRAGVRAGGPRGQPMNMHQHQPPQQQAIFGAGPTQFAPQVVPGSILQSSIPGLPPLHIPNNYNSLPIAQQQAIQQQIFQHQLIAAAAANQLFNPQALTQQQQPGQQPAQAIFPGQGQPESFQGQQQQAGAQSRPKKPSKPVRLPDRPSSEELCKYGVDCKNAICKYSHPSPSATKESGLVLTKEVCDRNLECEDQDCPKSHVSPAQKTDPEGKNIHMYTQKAAIAAPKPVPPPQPVAAANPGAKPCMYGAACTRPGCYFSHPVTTSTSTTPCRFGLACTRPDCHFSHPPGHRRAAGYGNSYNSASAPQKNKSATFGAAAAAQNGSTTTTTTATVAPGKDGESLVGKEDVKIDDSKMSARLKRFMENDQSVGERERIIDGQQVQEQTEGSKATEAT